MNNIHNFNNVPKLQLQPQLSLPSNQNDYQSSKNMQTKPMQPYPLTMTNAFF